MKSRRKSGFDVRWLVSGFILSVMVSVQVTDLTGPLMRAAEAVPLAMTHPVDELSKVEPLGELQHRPKRELVSAIAERSLFTVSRGVQLAQASEPTTARQVGGSEEPPELELVGTLLSNRSDVALIADGQAGPRRLQVGDTVSDWKIVRIQRDNLMLKQDDLLAPIKLR
ncbi:MAG: hypothetical protein ACR2P3_09430 [Geminicoccaceae bacterium]